MALLSFPPARNSAEPPIPNISFSDTARSLAVEILASAGDRHLDPTDVVAAAICVARFVLATGLCDPALMAAFDEVAAINDQLVPDIQLTFDFPAIRPEPLAQGSADIESADKIEE